jgi:hypothetical protein
MLLDGNGFDRALAEKCTDNPAPCLPDPAKATPIIYIWPLAAILPIIAEIVFLDPRHSQLWRVREDCSRGGFVPRS